jgi:hypothetical protein
VISPYTNYYVQAKEVKTNATIKTRDYTHIDMYIYDIAILLFVIDLICIAGVFT